MYDDAIAQAAKEAPHVQETLPTVPGLELHVDGDYLAYYASGNDDTTAGEARLNALSLIAEYRAATGADRVVMHNTANGSHKGERYLIATVKAYQSNRSSGRKPKNHAYLQDWLQSYEGEQFRTKNWTAREADDGLGVCSHFAIGKTPGYIAIATADKDMQMLPGLHVDWKTQQLTRVNPGDYDVMGINGKQYGLKWFFEQMLMGDAADAIPGLPEHRNTGSGVPYKKLGPKTATKLLEDCTNVAEAADKVEELYFLNYHRDAVSFAMRDFGTYREYADRLAEQAALLWMRCDLNAEVADFVQHKGHSLIPWHSDIQDAAIRLTERVTIARKEINELANSADPLCASE